MRYCDTTKYPKIYSDSYWGTCRGIPHQDIIDSRNQFVEDYGITKYKTSFYKMYVNGLDHQEFYEDNKGRIVHIFSCNPNGLNKDISSFKIIKPIYNRDQITGMRKFETQKSKKILMSSIFNYIPDEIVKHINSYIETKKKTHRIFSNYGR